MLSECLPPEMEKSSEFMFLQDLSVYIVCEAQEADEVVLRWKS